MTSFLKKVSLICVFVLFVGVITSCGNSSSNDKKIEVSLTSEEIYESSVKDVSSLPSLVKFSNSEFESIFGAKVSDFDDVAIYSSPMNVQSTEIGIFKYKDSEQWKKIHDLIDKRIEDLEAVWKRYLPDQYQLVLDYVRFENNGNVLAYIIAEDAEKIAANMSSVTTAK